MVIYGVVQKARCNFDPKKTAETIAFNSLLAEENMTFPQVLFVLRYKDSGNETFIYNFPSKSCQPLFFMYG